MIACSIRGGDELTDLFLGKEADVKAQNHNGQTALHLAVSKSSTTIVEQLLAHGASVKIKDVRGQLPLHRAAANGNILMLQLLLSHKSPINASDASGYTALHHGRLLQILRPMTDPFSGL